MSSTTLTNFNAFLEGHWRSDKALRLENGIIQALEDRDQLASAEHTIDCGGRVLAPGFIDTQVNGGGGKMLNQDPSLATVDTMRRAHWSGGTTAMLPTLITDSDQKMARAVDAVAKAIDTLPGIVGIHLEGPHLSVARKGVHDPEIIRPFSEHTRALLSLMPAQHYLLTVAPENMPAGTIATLTEQGIRISAGHTAASYDCVRAALDEGLCCFTHLHNAMSPLGSREPGAVGAALDDPHSYLGIIIDAYHVHPVTARLSIAAKPRGKVMLVSDAMATVGSDSDSFELYGETIYAVDGRCATEDGTLAGSALDMVSAVRNCVQRVGLPLEEALRMASQYPAAFLGIDDQRGHIRAGYRADLVLLNNDLSLHQTWLGGECCYTEQG